MTRYLALAFTCALVALAPLSAFAACTIPDGTAGDLIYNSSYNQMQFCNGTAWVNMGSSGTISGIGTLTNGNFCNTDGSLINCTTSSISLTSNVSGTLQPGQFPALTGDVTTSAGSLTTAIGAGKVTNAMLAGSIDYSKLSLTGAIPNADLAGSIAASKLVGTDIATVGTITSGVWNAGAVTSSGALAVTGDVAVNTNRFNVTAASGNTTIAGTLSVMGTITGPGSGLSALNASNLASGTVGTARLGSGTADDTTYLRGDGTWATPAGGGNIQGQIVSAASADASCGTVGQLGTDASGNLYVCKETSISIGGSSCADVGPGALTIDPAGGVYACLN